MISRALIVFGLVACKPPEKPRPPEHDLERRAAGGGSAAPPTSTIPSAPPEGFATADFVTTIRGDLAAYAIRDHKLLRTGVVTLVALPADTDPGEARFVDGVGLGDFADHDDLFLTIGDRSVVHVTATSVSKVAVPKPEEMTAPKPPKSDNPDSEPGSHNGHLIVTEGEAWWTECAWGFAADGFQCEMFVQAQLWPTPHIERGPSSQQPRGFVWPTVGPAGYVTRPLKRDYADTGIVCEPPKGQGTRTTLPADADESERIVGSTWVSQEPPRLLVIYGHEGYADLLPDRWTLHAGCTQKPLATGTTVEPGPNGLWIANSGADATETAPSTKRITIYRGGEAIGDLPVGSAVMFRPTK